MNLHIQSAAILIFFLSGFSSAFCQKKNSKPEIVGQTPLPLVTSQRVPITIQLTNLIVNDADPLPVYPNGFTLEIDDGKNYRAAGNVVTPDDGFVGRLTVRVRVKDGIDNSGWFDFQIDVTGSQNSVPRITGQAPLSLNQGGSLTVELGHLQVTDPDNDYPNGFTLKLFAGKDYTINGNTMTPSGNFAGKLKVPVTVNDGQNESNRFELKIDVVKAQNAAPKITGQSPLSVNEGGNLTVELGHLQVTDPDNDYPNGFTLKLFAGKDYAINGNTVTPSGNFAGKLKVPVTVNDGQNESNRFELKIDVIKAQNAAPKITGQSPLSVNEGGSLTVELGHLQVTDPDNNYPNGFTLKLFAGKDYTINGNTLTPSGNFAGKLKVPVTVNDGQNESNRFDLKVDVIKAQNAAPKITGQSPLSVNEGASLTVELGHLQVTDPDNNYPNGFTLKLFAGKDYAINGNTVTPSGNLSGNIKVPVTVNDGENESNRFELKIDVIKGANTAPRITGQSPLSINQGGSITLDPRHLQVTDPDNSYPTGFTLKVFGGNNYTFNGTTIIPSKNFLGQLTVAVTVNDGKDESNRFELKIEVIKTQNVAPKIAGQQPLVVNQNGSVTLAFAYLTVVDPDNDYPTGFTLKVFPGNNYIVTGNTIVAATDFTGTLAVSVTVNDGQNESNVFELKIEVVKTQNIAPQITGQEDIRINEDEAITLHLGLLTVTDPDNVYPKDFSIKIKEGPNYQASGSTITPARNFSGKLTVSVMVNDGQNDSAPFNINVNVSPVNDAPVISGQLPLSTNKNTLITLALTNLRVTDSDNKYPDDFTLKILKGDNYSFAANIVNPAPDFVGVLNVVVMVNDGKANSPEFILTIEVISPTENIPPAITGQKPIRITQNNFIKLQLSHLLVTDPDNEYPHGFILKAFPGADYSVAGTTVTPSADIVNKTISVTVKVNDGKDDSAPFQVKIQIVAPTARPQINGQKDLTVFEDSTLTINLTDLIVTDTDDPDYPTGFVLIVLPGDVYTRNGNSITPMNNLNGFIDVGVRISDGANASDEFKLTVLVTPVNDPPEFISPDTTALAYRPGYDPLPIFETVNLTDVDDDFLILAEVGFASLNYNPVNDQCIFSSETSMIRSVYDSAGRLFLIGYATIDDYITAVRSIQYNYIVTADENGNPAEILAGARKVYLTVFDGHLAGARHQRTITMDVEISLDIPNAFTPNGDQQNDTWHINLLNTDEVNEAMIRVFDKRGVMIHESTGFEEEWDGSSNGQTVPVDTYYYTIDLNLPYTRKTYKGVVSILH